MLVAYIIIAMMGVCIVIAVKVINDDEDMIENYRTLYELRKELEETESKYKANKLDELTYYFNLKQIKEEVAKLENELN